MMIIIIISSNNNNNNNELEIFNSVLYCHTYNNKQNFYYCIIAQPQSPILGISL